MSLRLRLVLCLAGVLAAILALGSGLAGWHASLSVRTELQAALAVGGQTAALGIAEAPAAPDALAALRHLVATFDGNRHVRATLTDARGTVVVASTLLAPTEDVPAWFQRVLAPRLAMVVLPAEGGSIRLVADATNEVGEVWGAAKDATALLVLFFALTVLLLRWAAGRALRPVQLLSGALDRVAAGDFAVRLPAGAPPELALLVDGFNRMAARLGTAEAQNRRMSEQLLTLQEEERAELARDLHDEFGPLLFAAGVDAASLPALLVSGEAGAAEERVAAIRDAVARMQSHLRAILGQLRPAAFGAAGLADAIATLVAFWRARHPAIAFRLDVRADDDSLSEAARATICRVVQESLCNAMRHGRPGRIGISVLRDEGDMVVRVENDGIEPQAGHLTPGFGLGGMRERVLALAGTLALCRPDGGGLAVEARLPCEAAS
jgi:two-component system sensor histidine kinase UhpB